MNIYNIQIHYSSYYNLRRDICSNFKESRHIFSVTEKRMNIRIYDLGDIASKEN